MEKEDPQSGCFLFFLMANTEMIVQADTQSWFVNLSELLRQDDMRRNIL